MNRRGFTLLEVVMGCAIAGVLAMVTAGLFRAGMLTYNYVYRETRTLAAARKAIMGDGGNFGMVWMTQNAVSASDLSPTSLSLNPASGVPTSFTASGGRLYQNYLSLKKLQAEPVDSIALSYYNLDSSGRIIASTVPANALFVMEKITVRSYAKKDRTYNFVAGARMRNHQ